MFRDYACRRESSQAKDAGRRCRKWSAASGILASIRHMLLRADFGHLVTFMSRMKPQKEDQDARLMECCFRLSLDSAFLSRAPVVPPAEALSASPPIRRHWPCQDATCFRYGRCHRAGIALVDNLWRHVNIHGRPMIWRRDARLSCVGYTIKYINRGIIIAGWRGMDEHDLPLGMPSRVMYVKYEAIQPVVCI